MKRTHGRHLLWFPVFLLLVATFSAGARAQSADEQPAHPATSTIFGNTGLWKVFSADGLPSKNVAFSVWYDRINRNPGYLTIGTVGISGAYGITSRLEFGMNFEMNKHILARRQDQLSFGQQTLGFFGNGAPGATPLPSELMPNHIIPQLRSPAFRGGALSGKAGYFNNLPWVGRSLGSNGVGTVEFGLKYNVLSEDRGNPAGIAFHGYGVIPTHRSANFLLTRPTQTGAWQLGFDGILTKRIGDWVEFSGNAGYRKIESPGGGSQIELSDEVPLNAGFIFMRKSRVQMLGELTSDIFLGSNTPISMTGARNPADWTIGLRGWLTKAISLSGGYRYPFNQFGGDKDGFVADLTFSTPPAKPAPANPPSLTCSADPTEFLAGQLVNLSAQGVSSSGKTLTYTWTTTGGTIEGSGPVVKLHTDNLAPGNYTQTVHAAEAMGLSADCTTRVTVRAPAPPPPPAQPPTVTCSADRPRVQVGEIVNITAQARSPQNRTLRYEWTSTGGRVQGDGATVRLDTTGLAAGSYTVRVRVVDDRNLSAECSVEVTVTAPPPPPPPPPPPQASKLNDCQFKANSARVDNVCKAKLDDVALRLRNQSDASVVIVGSADTRETAAARLAGNRANNTKAYLVREKGIAESRVEARQNAPARDPGNRRVDITLVPRGASFNQGSPVTTPLAPAPRARRPAAAATAPKKTSVLQTPVRRSKTALALVAKASRLRASSKRDVLAVAR